MSAQGNAKLANILGLAALPLFLLLGAFLLAAASPAVPEFPEITLTSLAAAIANHSVVLLDANGSTSFHTGHIPGAIDYEAAAPHLAALLPADQDQLIVAYCANEFCPHYLAAARAAAALGYTNIRHFAPGIAGWRKAGRPTPLLKP